MGNRSDVESANTVRLGYGDFAITPSLQSAAYHFSRGRRRH